ncbi:GH-E family nuclease (plasmid) [Neorhizobium galegae]|nr:GH-E family nuclease [Neorhizobium galegae]
MKRQDSKFSCCYGDEPGVGLGCKSNTVGDVVEPVTSSQIVRANGVWIQRHGDRCTLNKGNTEGEYVHVEATDSHKAPEGTDRQDQSGGKAEDTRSEGQKFSDGFTENAGETWEGLKKVGSDVLEGTKDLASDLWNDPTGTVAAGAESVKDGAVGAANWTADVAQNLYDDPGATLGRGWENTQNTASSIWHAVADPYSEAYDKGGLSQAIGHGTFDVVKLAVEALATKGAATVAGKTASIGAGVAAKAHKAEEVAETVSDARKIESKVEDGAQGARSTRETKPYSDPKKRPKYADGQVDDVWEAAKDENGDVYDPNTGEKLEWDKSKPRSGQWDMGHKPGHEYRTLHRDYVEGRLSKDEFLRQYRDPNNYQPESINGNRSHRYEAE